LILRVAAQMREFVASALLGFFNTIRRFATFNQSRRTSASGSKPAVPDWVLTVNMADLGGMLIARTPRIFARGGETPEFFD
jgi:hypothetical protein